MLFSLYCPKAASKIPTSMVLLWNFVFLEGGKKKYQQQEGQINRIQCFLNHWQEFIASLFQLLFS